MQPSLPPKLPILFIENEPALSDAVHALHARETIAFDLEFDSHRNAYGVTLCLIQVASRDVCYVIDPMAKLDLQKLWALFEDARIQKLVHSPGEDLRLLHSLGCFPKNVFDTEVVARLLNYEQTSLSAMLQCKLGYSLDKGQQRSNWLRRPLSPEQISYAADDVTGLHALKEILVAEAEDKGVLGFVLEEQEALSTTIHQQERKDFFLKSGDVANLSPYDQYVLNSLFLFRDELARNLNRPSFQVMDERIVRGLANGEILPADLPLEKGLYGSYKNGRFVQQVEEELDSIIDVAESRQLSRARPPRSSRDSVAARQQIDQDREAIFQPIQQELGRRYGAFAARFMLSNGVATEILKGNQTISGMKRAYRQRLMEEIAKELGISLERYL